MDRSCEVLNCNNEYYSRGVCKSHYSKFRRSGKLKKLPPLAPKFCSLDGCNERFSAKGFCEKHYRELKVKNNPMVYKNVEKRRNERYKERKREIIMLVGGGCSLCGYNKNIACLDFHHSDPKLKEKEPRDIIRTSNLPLIMEKLKGCILVCRNCHGEIHHPDEE